MTEVCEKCGHVNGLEPQKKTYIKIPDLDAFRDLCNALLASPNCTDPGFRAALEDFPGRVAKYKELSEKQVKFFKVIHHKVLGTWPEELSSPSRAATKPRALPEDDSEIPF